MFSALAMADIPTINVPDASVPGTTLRERHGDSPQCGLCRQPFNTDYMSNLGYSKVLVDTITCRTCERRLQETAR